MLQEKSQKLLTITILIIVVAFGFWIFNPLPLYFLNDDLIHIPLSKEGKLFQRQSFRPLADLSILLDHKIWEKNAVGYHLTNLLLHIVNSVLVFLLFGALNKQFGGFDSGLQSAVAAVLFFVYAFHSEAVFWIIGRSGSLGALFCIPAIIFYIKRHDNNFYFLLSVLCFILGLFAYESTWVFPFIAIAISVAQIKKIKAPLKTELMSVAIVFFVFFAHLIIKKQLVSQLMGEYEAGAFMKLQVFSLLANAVKLLARCFVPPVSNQRYFIVFATAVTAIFLLLVLLLSKRRSFPFIRLLLILFGISFIPYLSLGISTNTVEGERFEYLPTVFASLLLVRIIFSISKNSSVRMLPLSLLFCYHLYHLKKSCQYYRTASLIAKKTFEQINDLKGQRSLYIDSLPVECNGALIFRSGFMEGVGWLKEPGTVDNIHINSVKKINTEWRYNFTVKNFNYSSNSSFDEPAALSENARRPLNSETDAWFIYKNNALQVFK